MNTLPVSIMADSRKPRIFIGSSVESLPVADAVNVNLDHQAEVTIWRNGTFDLSSNTIDSLEEKAQSVDFSLFIFSPDDIAIIRQHEKSIVRDNVVFELGLFIGALGKERCFILKPRNVDLHLPTDLLGMTLADYETNRSDKDLDSAVNRACALIKKQMEKLSLKSPSGASSRPPKNSGNILSDLNQTDFYVLEEIVSTATTDPTGYRSNDIKESIKEKLHIQSYRIDLSILKLEKTGRIERKNEHDQNGYEYYVYSIASSGIEALLEREGDISQHQRQNKEKLISKLNDVPF